MIRCLPFDWLTKPTLIGPPRARPSHALLRPSGKFTELGFDLPHPIHPFPCLLPPASPWIPPTHRNSQQPLHDDEERLNLHSGQKCRRRKITRLQQQALLCCNLNQRQSDRRGRNIRVMLSSRRRNNPERAAPIWSLMRRR